MFAKISRYLLGGLSCPLGFLFLLFNGGCAQPPRREPSPQQPQADSIVGRVDVYPDFRSRHIRSRNVEVWLPDSYDPAKPHAVLYMNDGQNAFNPATSYVGVDWGIDEALDSLLAQGLVRDAIVVGIWNTDDRLSEYMPQKPDPAIRRVASGPLFFDLEKPVNSDDYLRFIVEELKPFVDSAYNTLPGPESTFIMGSSMGGLISIYALCEYPEVFGGAACVSTHWPADGGRFIREYLPGKLPEPGTRKLYFDHGDQTTDSLYGPFQQEVDALLSGKGSEQGPFWTTRVFPGEDHSERAWRDRVEQPLRFLLGP